MVTVAELTPPAVHAIALSPRDIPRIYALYTEALAAVPDPAAVRADAPAFFADIFAVGGEIIGLSAGDALVGYGVLRPELEREHDRVGLDRHVPAGAPMRVLDGSAVHPSFWSHGLQRTVIALRIGRAAELGAGHVIAKASPGNVPSMRNLTRAGFHIVGLVLKPYGWRYVHVRRVARPEPEPARGTWLVAADVDAAAGRFAAGEVAYRAKRDGEGVPMLLFGRTDEAA